MARCVRNGPAFFSIPHQVVDDIVCSPQLPNLFLHRVFEYALLICDECSLFLVVCDPLVVAAYPVAAPPVAPCVLASCSAIGTSVQSFFSSGSTFSAGSEATALVPDYGQERAAAK